MMRLILLFVSLYVNSAEVYSTWTKNYEKHVYINCYQRDGDLCAQVCEAQSKCVYPERTCRDCMSSSIILTHLFMDLNLYYSRGYPVDMFEFSDFLASGNFSSFTVLSLMNFNSGSHHQSIHLDHTFKSMCPNMKSRRPVIFFSVDPILRSLDQAQYVACNDDSKNPKVYRLYRKN